MAHLELDATAEGELWMLAGGQITGREKKSESVKMKVIHPGFSLFRLSLLFICLFIFFFFKA